MSNMMFSFEFDGNDIDREEAEDIPAPDKPSEEMQVDPATAIDPEKHSLEHMLSFLPSQIFYSVVAIEYGENSILELPRRAFYDIRQQIMAEDNMNDSEPQHGLSTGDITPNVYEGGFKTWECSIDLANTLAEDYNTEISGRDPAHSRLNIVELGAGSALPSLVVFQSLLSRPKTDYQSSPAVYFTLCDYNVTVLTHSTLPNFVLVWCASNGLLSENPTDDIEITPELIERFTIDLADRKIHIYGISGAWGPALVDLLPQMHGDKDHPVKTLVLASETIYATSTLAAFTETLTSILRIAERNGGTGLGMVAVKQVYFGVGGGADDFKKELTKLGGQSEVLWMTPGMGVGRVVLGVSLRLGQVA